MLIYIHNKAPVAEHSPVGLPPWNTAIWRPKYHNITSKISQYDIQNVTIWCLKSKFVFVFQRPMHSSNFGTIGRSVISHEKCVWLINRQTESCTHHLFQYLPFRLTITRYSAHQSYYLSIALHSYCKVKSILKISVDNSSVRTGMIG